MTSFSFNSFPIESWEEEALASSVESAKKSRAEECFDEKTYPSNWNKDEF